MKYAMPTCRFQIIIDSLLDKRMLKGLVSAYEQKKDYGYYLNDSLSACRDFLSGAWEHDAVE